MRRLSIVSVVVATAAIAAVLVLAYSASAKRDANYVGSEECVVCHEDTHPEMVAAHAKTMHALAMVDATKKPAAIVAKFDADSPVKKQDIKYVLGVGKVYQNYLDKNLKVLPGKWDSKQKKWVKAAAVDGATQCVGCHTTNFNPVTRKWTEMGVGCESCHGPGGDHAESMEASDIVNLRKLDSKKLDMVCGQCHATGTDLPGKHAFSATFMPGQELDKHFKLKPPTDGAANAQYNQFLASKHAAGGAMKCTTCHDTHGDKAKDKHQLRRSVNELCMGCHSMDLGETKGIESIKAHAPNAADDATCASCHMVRSSHDFKKASPR